ncbi:vinorine synthase-like [Durio zibethinus]|uniref:Vinorine synthase-like n=1 Tax=Durio zibethinus TaxID=66656 RepID=A0A6P5Z1Y6_DURZI|nr:vinorine synthase-like [Durio zibethinus]
MEVRITSREMVKPSSPDLHLLKPFKLSLLDQLSPPNYVPFIFFYTKHSDSQFESFAQVSDHLKKSLSKTLNQFYPLSGRTKNNLCVSSYEEGVQYVEARVNACLSDYIEKTEGLFQTLLLYSKLFCYIPNSTIPQLAIQLSIFDCGGIALAFCCCHKILDASTVSAFLKSWAAFSRGSNGEIPNPDLLEAPSRFFPPIESTPPNTSMKGLFFNEGRRETRSFVFDANAIATLMFKAKSKRLELPSRVVALSAFLWKHAIRASRSTSGILKPAILSQSVNIRQKMKPQLPDYSIGNLFLLPITTYNSVEKDVELHDLAYLVREGVESVTGDFLELFQGEEGFKVMSNQLSQIAEIVSKGNAQFYILSSWLNTLEGKEDFGWGKPTLFSIPGVDSHNREFSNCIILKGTGQHKAIEAWVTLSDKEMAFLEQDPEFLAFASRNP